jgi:hypothetical protein
MRGVRRSWLGDGKHRRITRVEIDKVTAEAANDAWMSAVEPLNTLTAELVDKYFDTFGAKTKKEEHLEAVRLGIYQQNYRSYLNEKIEGKSIGHVCYGQANRAWIASLADARGCRPLLDALTEERDRKRAEWEAAAGAVIRWPLEPR